MYIYVIVFNDLTFYLSIYSNLSRDVSPKWSFVSGGRVLTVYGNNLDTVEQPYIAALDHRY